MAQPQQPSDPVDDVVLASSSTGNAEGVQVSLHPLPLLSISEHYTRVRVQNEHDGRKDIRVIGALIGIQQGREVEIVNSFELATNPEGTEVNHDFFVQRQSQFKQVFPTFEFLGWYSIGPRPTALDLAIHTQLLPYNESPLFLQLHPNSHVQGSNLPLSIYESVVDIVAGKSVTKFVKIAGEDGGYRIETGEAERIAVESASRTAVANASTGGRAGQESSESTLVAGLTTQRNAIAMLHSRIEVVLQYLDAVQQGKQAPDHETLRQIASLVSSIASSSTHSSSHSTSTPQPSDFLTEFEREKNDVLLTSLLGQMTRNLEATNTLVDKFSLQQNRDREGDDGGSRMGGRRGIGQGGAGGAVRNKMASGAGAAWRRGGGGAGGGFDFD